MRFTTAALEAVSKSGRGLRRAAKRPCVVDPSDTISVKIERDGPSKLTTSRSVSAARHLPTVLLAATAIAITAPGHGVIAAGKTASFNVTAVHSGPGSKVTLNSKVWVTEQQARADVSNPVQGSIRFLVADGNLYQIDPAKKKYVKSALPPEMKKKKDNFDALVARFAFDAGDALKTARKLRSEKQAGFLCDVYTASAKDGDSSRKLTVWMPQTARPRFPVKAVMQDQMKKPGAEASRTVTITLSNVKLNQPIPASIFATPRGFSEVKPKPAAAPRPK